MQHVTDDEICARSGGDEFVVLIRNATAEKASAFIEKVRALIDKKVFFDGKDYKVGVSTGIYILDPDEVKETDAHKVFEKCLKEADSAMYIEKKQRKASGNGEN
jgi:diguanylate cyclase (GGDEF)-like protein